MSTLGGVELFFMWLGVTYAIAQFSNMSRDRERDRKYYDRLKRPAWAPRGGAVFGIVWFILYTLQALAVTRIRQFGAWEAGVNRGALVLYVILQFVLASYSFLFFTARSLWASTLSVFVSLVLAIIETVFAFQLDVLSGVVFVLLDIWLLYALSISIGTWYLTNGDRMVRRGARSQL